MALININADFSRVASALERIANAIERLSPPPDLSPIEMATEDDVYYVAPDGIYSSKIAPGEEYLNYGPRQNY